MKTVVGDRSARGEGSAVPEAAKIIRVGEGRALRSDARRNLESLLHAAMTVFTAAGVDAPVRTIAEAAGVGVGTIYRHFPQRSDLIVAVFRHEVDDCADAAVGLAAAYDPSTALALWMGRYVDFVAAKRGLGAALHSGDPAYAALPAYFEARLRPALQGLLQAAASVGAARTDVDPLDLLRAVALLSAPCGNPGVARRMVALLLDGLRVGIGPT